MIHSTGRGFLDYQEGWEISVDVPPMISLKCIEPEIELAATTLRL